MSGYRRLRLMSPERAAREAAVRSVIPADVLRNLDNRLRVPKTVQDWEDEIFRLREELCDAYAAVAALTGPQR